jgi:hypothetical protein
MPEYSRDKIDSLIAIGLDKSRVTKERGDALEELFCYLLCELPGIAVQRNLRDPFQSKEVDITVGNAQEAHWLKLYPTAFLVECKNWDHRVGSRVVVDFIVKLEESYVEAGILVAANGITGNSVSKRAAYQRIAMAQSRGHRIIVVTLEQLRNVQTTDDLEILLRDRFLKVVGSGDF